MQPVSECTPGVPSVSRTLPSSVNDFATEFGSVGGVDDVVDDLQAVRVPDLTGAPGADVGSIAVEDDDRWILALKDIDAIP